VSGRIGVLLANVGTPDAPTYWAVRRFLSQFLTDRRVVNLSRWIWLPILYLFVLTFRPLRSARAYRKVWTEAGSPLLLHGKAQAQAVQKRLRERLGEDIDVCLGMAYGTPSIGSALAALHSAGCERLVCLPLFPQSSGSTTGSVSDQVSSLQGALPGEIELQTIDSYGADPSYISALVASLGEAWQDGQPDALVLSFHSIPSRYVEAGDLYQQQCEQTAGLLRAELSLPSERIHLTYQSRFGPVEWIGPSTQDTLLHLGAAATARVDVVCPGFSADCLETLEEIGIAGRQLFESAGGGELRLIPCLNDRPDHIEALCNVLEAQIQRAPKSAAP
jgi:ferrochelatase